MLRNPALALLLILGAGSAHATEIPIAIDDYVVVYAQLMHECFLLPRIVDAHKVTGDDQYLLNLGPVQLLGSTTDEIRTWLVDEIAAARPDGNRPDSVRVEILKTEQEYLMIRDEVLATKKFLAGAIACGKIKPRPDQRETIDPDWYRIIDPDWYRIAGTPNNSLQRILPAELRR